MSNPFKKFCCSVLFVFPLICHAEFDIGKNLNASLTPVDFLRNEKNYGKDVYHVCEGMPGILTLGIKITDNISSVKKLEIILQVPEGFSIIGAAPSLPTKKENGFVCRPPEPMSAENITRGDVKYRQYTILASDCFIKPPTYGWRWNASEYIYIKAEPDSKADCGKVYWRFRVNDSLLAVERQFEIKRLPRMEAPLKPLRRFQFMQFSLTSQISPFPEVRDAYLSFYKSVHARPVTMWDYSSDNWVKAYPPSARNEITKIFDTFVFVIVGNGSGDVSFHHFYMPQLQKDSSLKIDWLIREDGKPFHNEGKPLAICPNYLVSDRSDDVFWNKLLPEFIDYLATGSPQPRMLVWDYEPIPKTACLCETCRRGLMEFMKGRDVPSPEQIKTVCKKQWFDYQVKLHNMIVVKFAAMAKAHFPLLTFWICSDPLHADVSKDAWCSLDPRESDKYADGHLPMPYYSGTNCFDDMALNAREMKNPVWEIIAPTCYMELFTVRYTPEKTLQNIISSAATGNIGIGLYEGDNYDGLYFSKINEAFQLLAKAENYYFGERNDALIKVAVEPLFSKTVTDDGQKININYPDQSKLRYTVFKRDDSMLLNIFNYDEANDCVVRISIPGETSNSYSVYDLRTGELFVDSNGNSFSGEQLKQGFLYSVPENGVSLLEFKAESERRPQTKTMAQNIFLEKFESVRASYANCSFPGEVSSGKAAISYGDIDKNTRPELRLDLNGSKVYVDFMGGGEIIGWKKASDSLSDLFNHYGQHGFCDKLFLYQNLASPAACSSFKFNVRQAVINERNFPELVLAHKIPPVENAATLNDPMEGLAIEKTVRIEDDGKTLSLTWRFKNENPNGNKIPMALRLKMLPKYGGKYVAGDRKTIESVTQISFKTKDGYKIIKSGSDVENVFVLEGCENMNFLKDNVSPMKWVYSPIVITTGNGKGGESFEVCPDQDNTAGCYVYWNEGSCYTVELLSKEVLLSKDEMFSFSYSIKRNN